MTQARISFRGITAQPLPRLVEEATRRRTRARRQLRLVVRVETIPETQVAVAAVARVGQRVSGELAERAILRKAARAVGALATRAEL